MVTLVNFGNIVLIFWHSYNFDLYNCLNNKWNTTFMYMTAAFLYQKNTHTHTHFKPSLSSYPLTMVVHSFVSSTHLYIHPLFRASICPSVHLFSKLSRSIYISIHPSFFLVQAPLTELHSLLCPLAHVFRSFHTSLYPSIHLYIHPPLAADL